MIKLEKKIKALSVLGLSLSLLAGCSSAPTTANSSNPAPAANTPSPAQTGAVKTMRIGLALNEQSVPYKASVKFKELVEKYSNNTIQVQIAPSAQLGGELSMVQQAQSGALESTVVSTAPIGNIVPEITLFDLPFLFKDESVADKVIEGPFGKKILDKMADKQLIGLAYWENGFRDLTNSKKQVKTLDDLKDLKIRTMENPLHLDFWRALGANPTPMSFDQVFNALQQKVIDAQENPVQTIYTSKLYEAQKYLTLTHHIYSPHVFLVSKTWFDQLSKEQQEAIKKAAQESRTYNLKINRDEAQTDIDALKQKGMQVDTLPDETRAKIQQAIKPVIDKYTQKYPDLAKELLDAVKEAEKK